METRPISKSLSKILKKSRATSMMPLPIQKNVEHEKTKEITLAEAGTFDTMESPYKSIRIMNKRRKDARTKNSDDDDASTVFWSKFSRTRETKLKGTFVLPNCVKTFRISISGVDSSGTYGLYTSWLTVQKLFNVIVKVPPFIRSHEEVRCYLTMENNKRGDMQVEIPQFKDRVDISQGSGANYDFHLKPETLPFKLKIVDTNTREKILKKIQIPVYRGLYFEENENMNVSIFRGNVNGNLTQLQLPRDLKTNTTKIRIEYKQLGVDIIMKGIENLINQPSGGFEQTCSVAFALTLLIKYINNFKTKSEKLVNMKIFAEERLDETMEKFQRFECVKGGFEMFGSGEGDVTLSAYGIWLLSELLLIKKIKDVTMLNKTLQWLRENYRDKGSKGLKFLMKKHLRPGQAHPSQFRSDIYIMFVLTQMRNRFADYKTIVSHKIDDYDMKPKKQRLDSYLRSLLAMIYAGNELIFSLIVKLWERQKIQRLH
jgi:uncharacterized protein YfaS (alpha-2-macroglobulin family)